MNVYAIDYGKHPLVGGPYSNAFAELFAAAGAPAATEKFVLGDLPAGALVTDFDEWHDDFGTSVTFDFGFETLIAHPANTVLAVLADGTKVTANNSAYWFDNKDVATAAGRSASSALSIEFRVPVRIVAVVTGTITGTPDVGVVVKGHFKGPR